MVDINLLKTAIKRMSRRSKLYKALKEELSLLGYWKNKARGNAKAGGEARKAQGITYQ